MGDNGIVPYAFLNHKVEIGVSHMNILAIDTSNQVLGLALIQEQKVIAEYVTNSEKNHSVRLMPAVTRLMEDVQMSPEQLDKIVVAKGPGSYTGVRIGLTTAKTMAWSLDIPVVGVSSLEVLAAQADMKDTLVCPFFDARRGLVFTGLYKMKDGRLKNIQEDQNILLTEWLDMLKEIDSSVLFISTDADKHKELITDQLGAQAQFISQSKQLPSPVQLAFLGLDRDADDVHQLQPSYLRLVEAEAKWLAKQKDLNKNG